jgi:CBS domain containing-hemolysin-like protein
MADPTAAGAWPWQWVVLALALVPATGLLFALAALLERSGPVRLRHWAEEAGGELLALYRRPGRFAAFRFLLSLAAKLAPLALFVVVARAFAGIGLLTAGFAAAIVAVAVAAGAELLGRRLVDGAAEDALERLTPVYRAARLVLTPLAALLAPLVRPRQPEVEEDEDEEEASDEEIAAFIDFGTREGILEPGEGDMVWGIVDLAETEVKSVMTPRTDVAAAAAEESLDALADRFLESGHSRLPLYEGSIDRIVGILHIRDLLRALRSGSPLPAPELAKPPLVVPETKKLAELLREMQASQQQLAIVVDEYGGTAGLVTVEDLVEEIVGEIADEHEEVEPEAEALPDGGWRLDGGTPIEVLDDLFGIDLEEEPYETVGGLVLSVLGSLPEPGQEVVAHGLRLAVEGVENRRIQSVRVERAARPSPPPPEAAGEEDEDGRERA